LKLCHQDQSRATESVNEANKASVEWELRSKENDNKGLIPVLSCGGAVTLTKRAFFGRPVARHALNEKYSWWIKIEYPRTSTEAKTQKLLSCPKYFKMPEKSYIHRYTVTNKIKMSDAWLFWPPRLDHDVAAAAWRWWRGGINSCNPMDSSDYGLIEWASCFLGWIQSHSRLSAKILVRSEWCVENGQLMERQWTEKNTIVVYHLI